MTSYVYILRCRDGSYHTGRTDRSLEERVAEHQAGGGSCHTRKFRPVALVWFQEFERFDDAVFAEREIKGWRRDKKDALIKGEYHRLPELSSRVLRDEAARVPQDRLSRRDLSDHSSTPPQGERTGTTQSPNPRPEAWRETARLEGHPPTFNLTTYLPYLINRTGVQVAGAFSQEIAHHGVTLQMWRALAALNHRNALRISDLAGLTSIDISTLSRLVGKMEKQELVARCRADGVDARVVTVALTTKGRVITEAILPVAQRYEAMALAGFTQEEAAALRQMLRRVYNNLDGGTLDTAA